MAEKIVITSSSDQTAALCGVGDCNITTLEKRFSVKIMNRRVSLEGSGDALIIQGESYGVDKAEKVFNYLKRMVSAGEVLSDQTIEYIIGVVEDGQDDELAGYNGEVLCITSRGKPIKPKTIGQKKYTDLIRKNTVILGIGPAGTGKTFLAVAMAVEALRAKEVSRIILTRPAVEAGERLGFLPGDLQSKIDPYLRPLYDALFEMLGPENYARHLERNTIEIAPLAYMRGRTLDDSFIILDEAQNTTSEQMKMFLTRLGSHSKAVVTGDPSQTDLPFGKKSGLGIAAKILKNIDDIAIHHFTERDVVRHKLVQKIISAYDKYERDNKQQSTRKIYAKREGQEK